MKSHGTMVSPLLQQRNQVVLGNWERNVKLNLMPGLGRMQGQTG